MERVLLAIVTTDKEPKELSMLISTNLIDVVCYVKNSFMFSTPVSLVAFSYLLKAIDFCKICA